ncbi:NYN domain-containing protein [Desertimonas flava]|uniref:NYN domain-containing protein n=1 Tax=Desertimonas flava TaxID=2064846 RepID=UPI000E34A854|nr:NYN domain-containing protein [Desertimonas flava]
METTPAPGPTTLEHRHLRSALEFAVGVADAGQRLKPPLVFPPELKPFLKQQRLPGAGLGRIRRAIEADPEYRHRLAVAATAELVDPIGLEWLRREEGWEDRISTLIEAEAEAAAEADAALALKRSERRREAAEQVAVRTRTELAALTEQLEERTRELSERADHHQASGAELEQLRADLAAAKQAARHAGDRTNAAQQRLAGVEAERDAALARAAEAERQRDELLAARAEQHGVPVSATQLGELRELAEWAKGIADRMSRLVDVRPARRVPIGLPGPLARDPRKAAEYLLKTPSVLVFVDGYNVAKLTWPDLDLQAQREHLLDAVDTVARRYGSDITVVFDGADIPGSHTRARRLARVRYSPGGVIADDVIRSEVSAADASRPVVVVTNDAEIRRDVTAAGANVVASDTFAAVALG